MPLCNCLLTCHDMGNRRASWGHHRRAPRRYGALRQRTALVSLGSHLLGDERVSFEDIVLGTTEAVISPPHNYC